jgi:hypothetical protein
VVEAGGKPLTKFKTDFNAYASYNITKQPPEIVNEKNISYRVFLKLNKSGPTRTKYEQVWFKDPQVKAQEFMAKIQTGVANFPNSQFVRYPTKVNLMKKRIALWGHKVVNKKELLKTMPIITQQDFGIKDVVALEILATIFFNEKLSNEKLMSNVQGILAARRKVRHEPG